MEKSLAYGRLIGITKTARDAKFPVQHSRVNSSESNKSEAVSVTSSGAGGYTSSTDGNLVGTQIQDRGRGG